KNRSGLRWQLLATASAIVLMEALSAGEATAGSDSAPLVWIELGGAYSQSVNDQTQYLPPFAEDSQFPGARQANLQKPPSPIWDEPAKITPQPPGTDWSLSASIIYGRNSKSHIDNQLTTQVTNVYGANYWARQTVAAKASENHLIMD